MQAATKKSELINLHIFNNNFSIKYFLGFSNVLGVLGNLVAGIFLGHFKFDQGYHKDYNIKHTFIILSTPAQILIYLANTQNQSAYVNVYTKLQLCYLAY